MLADGFDCNYVPDANGLTALGWLSHVRDVLSSSVSTDPARHRARGDAATRWKSATKCSSAVGTSVGSAMISATMSTGPAEEADPVQDEEHDAGQQRVAPAPDRVDELRAPAGEEDDRRQHHRSRVPGDDQDRQPERDDPERAGADRSDHEVQGVAERVHRLAEDGDRPIAAGDEAVDRVEEADRAADRSPRARARGARAAMRVPMKQDRDTRISAECGQPVGDAVAIDRGPVGCAEQRGTADDTDRDRRPTRPRWR